MSWTIIIGIIYFTLTAIFDHRGGGPRDEPGEDI